MADVIKVITQPDDILMKIQSTIDLFTDTFKEGDSPFRITLIHSRGLISPYTVDFVCKRIKIPPKSTLRVIRGPDWLDLQHR